MSVSVAEYLGQRTDISSPTIIPVSPGVVLTCPFMNVSCSKLAMNRQQKPICSVKKIDGSIWIVCRHRLCSTMKNASLTGYQVDFLHQIAKTIFNPSVQLSEIAVKREVRMAVVGRSSYSADYVMILNSNAHQTQGPTRVVLEMQGGGETSNTGKLTAHIGQWESNPSNSFLSNVIVPVGTIETNAWRRQQEQFLVKGNITMQTGGGMVFCVGSPLYDYLWARVKSAPLNNLRNHNWTLALIGICEDTSIQKIPGPIPLKVDSKRLLFTNYASFVQALTNQGSPSQAIFQGACSVLDGSTVVVR